MESTNQKFPHGMPQYAKTATLSSKNPEVVRELLEILCSATIPMINRFPNLRTKAMLVLTYTTSAEDMGRLSSINDAVVVSHIEKHLSKDLIVSWPFCLSLEEIFQTIEQLKSWKPLGNHYAMFEAKKDAF